MSKWIQVRTVLHGEKWTVYTNTCSLGLWSYVYGPGVIWEDAESADFCQDQTVEKYLAKLKIIFLTTIASMCSDFQILVGTLLFKISLVTFW